MDIKSELMTDKQKELASKYLGYYRAAYRDKQGRGIPDDIEKFDKYWEGDVNKPETESDPGSNINIIHPNIEGQVAMLLEQNIAVQPLPVTPAEQPFAESVRIVLEFIKDKNKLMRKLDIHERRREKYGTGILRVIFDPDALGGVGLPIIEPCNNPYVYVDPCITDVYKVQEAEYIIETVTKSVYWARELYGDEIADAIDPNVFPEAGDVYKEHDGTGYDGSDRYLHMLVWTKEKGKLRLVEMTGCGLILSDSFDKGEESFYPSDKYPYFFTPLYFREGSIWGKGDVELLIPIQDLINDLDDQIRINARLTGNPQRLIETGSGIDLDALTNEAGLNIPTNSVNSIKNLEAPSLPSYIENRRNQALQYETQRVTRFSDQMTGNKQQGVGTATESLALQQAGTTGIQHKKILLQETLSEVFEYCLDLVKEYWSEEISVRITDKNDEFIFFKGSELKTIPDLMESDQRYRQQYVDIGAEPPSYMMSGETKDAEFDIKVTVGAGLPTNKAFVYKMMMELTMAGLITPQETRKWLVENMGLPVTPELEQVQPTQGQVPLDQNGAEIQGINEAGNVKLSDVRAMQEGGGMP